MWPLPGSISGRSHQVFPHEDTEEDGNLRRMPVAGKEEGRGMKVLDLCAGTGSATRAFLDRGHDVETLDTSGKHTYIKDVRTFVLPHPYDFIWASPPCIEFSLLKRKKCSERNPDMSIVHACLVLCKQAPYWILENPRACLRHFIGKPIITVRYSDFGDCVEKPTDLWGCFPFFWSTTERQMIRKWKDDPNGRKNRATIPYGLSLAICKAIEREIA